MPAVCNNEIVNKWIVRGNWGELHENAVELGTEYHLCGRSFNAELLVPARHLWRFVLDYAKEMPVLHCEPKLPDTCDTPWFIVSLRPFFHIYEAPDGTFVERHSQLCGGFEVVSMESMDHRPFFEALSLSMVVRAIPKNETGEFGYEEMCVWEPSAKRRAADA